MKRGNRMIEKIVKILARILASLILLALVGGALLSGYVFIKDNIEYKKIREERKDNPFHDSWDWEVCDDECYIFVNNEELVEKDNGDEGWMEYRFISDTLMYVRYYEDDYNDIHDFNIIVKGDYTFFSAEDYD
jgi:hypothetical protein